MKIIKSTPRPGGKTRLIIELDADERIQPYKDGEKVAVASKSETLIAINPDLHYKLGEPLHEDVFAGHIIADAHPAIWCSLEQKWLG